MIAKSLSRSISQSCLSALRGFLSVGNPNLVVNGSFDTDTSGWEPDSASTIVTWDNGRIGIDGSSWARVTQWVPTEVGKIYRATVRVDEMPSDAEAYLSIEYGENFPTTVPGTIEATWQALETSSEITIGLYNNSPGPIYFDDVTYRLDE